MTFNDIGMLITTGNRSKAYLQYMKKNNLFPSFCIIMSDDFKKLEMDTEEYKQEETDYYNINEPVLWTIKSMNIEYLCLKTNDINSLEVYEELRKLNQNYIIVSGFAGQILKKELFELNKKYIHIHPGIIPDYRGSTTIYYSLLNENNCGATAFILDEKIDTGDVIMSKSFNVDKSTPNIDYIYDPFIRAQLLVAILKEYQKNGEFKQVPQNRSEGETFFIIHPVLKHVALLSINNMGGNKNEKDL